MENCKFDHISPHTYRCYIPVSMGWMLNAPKYTEILGNTWKYMEIPESMGWMLHGRNAPSPTTLCTSVTFPPGKVDLSGILRQSQGKNQYFKIKFGLFSNNIHLVVCLHCPFIILYSLITGFQLLFPPVVFRTKLLISIVFVNTI